MSRMKNLPRAAILGLSIAFSAGPAHAEQGWLEQFNQAMFSFNAGVSETLKNVSEKLPNISPEIKIGARSFANTWIGEPLNIGAHLIAGRTDDAGTALRRMGVNITRGWLGTVDRAAEEGLRTNPIDFGLALCVRGVPAGPFIVVPFTGMRTLRDFGSDWVAAHAILYGALFGVLDMPVSTQNLLLVEAVDEWVTLAIAGELGETPADAKASTLEVAQKRYLAGRERRCAELAKQ